MRVKYALRLFFASLTVDYLVQGVFSFVVKPSLQQSNSRSNIVSSFVSNNKYYGESADSYMVKEFSTYEQLEEIVKLAALPLPERPDGIVTVAKYTSSSRPECVATEGEYERLARKNPATIFLRCFAEYEDAHIILGKADVQTWPCFDIFYRGNRVARVVGSNLAELEEMLDLYQFQNSSLDLFSEASPQPWGDRKVGDFSKTPRTTNRFIPGYDWNSDRGFFDAQADKAQEDFDNMFGNWVPNVEDD